MGVGKVPDRLAGRGKNLKRIVPCSRFECINFPENEVVESHHIEETNH
jgi:hypothetical protein